MRVVSFTVSPETARFLALTDMYDICRGLVTDFSWTRIGGFTKDFVTTPEGERVKIHVLLTGNEDINVA